MGLVLQVLYFLFLSEKHPSRFAQDRRKEGEWYDYAIFATSWLRTQNRGQFVDFGAFLHF